MNEPRPPVQVDVHTERLDSPWNPSTPAAVSITGIAAVAVLEGLAIAHNLDGSHFYTALGIIAAICGIHMRFAPLIAGSRR